MLIKFLLILSIITFPVGSSDKATIEAELSDGSFIIQIRGKRYRALDSKAMNNVVIESKRLSYVSSRLIECEMEKIGKSEAE